MIKARNILVIHSSDILTKSIEDHQEPIKSVVWLKISDLVSNMITDVSYGDANRTLVGIRDYLNYVEKALNEKGFHPENGEFFGEDNNPEINDHFATSLIYFYRIVYSLFLVYGDGPEAPYIDLEN